MMTPRSATAAISTAQPLSAAIVTLAETPDDLPDVDVRRRTIARLAADRIAAVEYAAVSARPDDGHHTVAVSSRLAESVDEAVGADGGANSGAVTMSWPNFRRSAVTMGLGVVSVPLFTGSGAAASRLDLYSRDMATMAPLAAGISAAFDPDLPQVADDPDMALPDSGAQELLDGFAEAMSVRATIQLAVAIISGAGAGAGRTRDAYTRLRLDAADAGVSLRAAATSVITDTIDDGR
jgi:hypothetical protein